MSLLLMVQNSGDHHTGMYKTLLGYLLHQLVQNFLPSTVWTLVGGWTNPFEKYAPVKLDHFPKDRSENKKPLDITTETGMIPSSAIWVFPKIGVPQNGWFNPIKMDDLGVPLFLETPLYFFLLSWKVSLPIIHFQLRTAIFEECNIGVSAQKIWGKQASNMKTWLSGFYLPWN